MTPVKYSQSLHEQIAGSQLVTRAGRGAHGDAGAACGRGGEHRSVSGHLGAAHPRSQARNTIAGFLSPCISSCTSSVFLREETPYLLCRVPDGAAGSLPKSTAPDCSASTATPVPHLDAWLRGGDDLGSSRRCGTISCLGRDCHQPALVQPITVALNNMAGSYIVEWNVQMAGAILALPPTLLADIFLGRYFMPWAVGWIVEGMMPAVLLLSIHRSGVVEKSLAAL